MVAGAGAGAGADGVASGCREALALTQGHARRHADTSGGPPNTAGANPLFAPLGAMCLWPGLRRQRCLELVSQSTYGWVASLWLSSIHSATSTSPGARHLA